MSNKKNDRVRNSVRENYSRVAKDSRDSCGCSPTCCGDAHQSLAVLTSLAMGYSVEDLNSIPESANMGLGCGNPKTISELKTGEVVLDLGAGGGLDCFLASRQVGPDGLVIGVDMTPEMVSLSRENAENSGFTNIDFRLGEIENLPVADSSVDAILSNCVINLSPDKQRVFDETFRVLKPTGRLAISDVVARKELPDEILNNPDLLSGCIAGAVQVEVIERMLNQSGFSNILISLKTESLEFIKGWSKEFSVADYVISAEISARKPE